MKWFLVQEYLRIAQANPFSRTEMSPSYFEDSVTACGFCTLPHHPSNAQVAASQQEIVTIIKMGKTVVSLAPYFCVSDGVSSSKHFSLRVRIAERRVSWGL